MLFVAALIVLLLSFWAVHFYGAATCARLLPLIAGGPLEQGVRERMPGIRSEMIIVTLGISQGTELFWPKGRPSIFGFSAMNATVWLALYDARFELPDELLPRVRLLRALRWAEVALILAGLSLVAWKILSEVF